MKCSRPNCRRRARAKDLCELHYTRAGYDIGLVDSTAALNHINYLLESGVSMSEMTRASGVSWPALNNIRKGGLILRSTEVRLLKVQPGLEQRVAAETKIPVLGVRRRLRALAAIGYTSRYLAGRLEVQPVTVWRYMYRVDNVEVFVARRVHTLFDELHLTPGPSKRARNTAARNGWLPPMAFDDIDDPNENPVLEDRQVLFSERLAELEYLNIPRSEMPTWLGIEPDSFERNLSRMKERQLKEAV